MSDTLEKTITQICEGFGNNRARMMDIVRALQQSEGCVSSEAMDIIAKQTGCKRVEVEGVVSFYAFLSKDKKGEVVVRVCNDVVDNIKGADAIFQAFSDELGISAGETTKDGKITLEHTPCIGMSDQAPAALINEIVVTGLTPQSAKDLAKKIKSGDTSKISQKHGDGNNANDLVKSMVNNNICKKGEVLFADIEAEAGLKKALSMTPEQVIDEVKTSNIRGRGGAGFPTGLKWEFTRGASGDKKVLICNADEGEPGTFKDRVLLTERYDLIFGGMTIGGYAIGADVGIIYLRAEYFYLKALLEKALEDRRNNGLLGEKILGKEGFNFDIRIQVGAGAYICGEETALISSCEGLRGDPKNRPPFPAQKGYLGLPTAVNNVETFCSVSRIIEKGSAWFGGLGSGASSGTKLLSVSGDCSNPGVFEFPFGVKITDVLKESGAKDTQAVLVGGPSGQFIGQDKFTSTIAFDDLATGGSIVIFNKNRDLLKVAEEYMDFFIEESCGYCTPCRAGNVILLNGLKKIIAGEGEASDLEYLQQLGASVKFSSRCGLGQTSPNPIVTTIKNFRSLYESKISEEKDGFVTTFDVKKALSPAEDAAGRSSEIF